MYIQFFNFTIAIGANSKNLMFLLCIVYSISITVFYAKCRLESAAVKTYYEDQIIDMKTKFDKDTHETKIQLYEEYIKEKEKLLKDFKNSSYTTTKLPEDYYVDVSKYENNTEKYNGIQEF